MSDDHALEVVELDAVPAPGVVELLQRLLKRAEAGEIVAVAVAVQLRTGGTGGYYDTGGPGADVSRLYLSIERVKLLLADVVFGNDLEDLVL